MYTKVPERPQRPASEDVRKKHALKKKGNEKALVYTNNFFVFILVGNTKYLFLLH